MSVSESEMVIFCNIEQVHPLPVTGIFYLSVDEKCGWQALRNA